MNRYATHYLLSAAAVLIILMTVCLSVDHSAALLADGISRFGVEPLTVLPYTVALAGTAALIHRAGKVLAATNGPRWLCRALNLIVASAVGIAVTPYTIHEGIFGLHLLFTQILFWTEMYISVRLLYGHSRPRHDIWVFALQFTGSAWAFFAVFNMIGLMFVGQVLAQIGFITMLLGKVAGMDRELLAAATENHDIAGAQPAPAGYWQPGRNPGPQV